MSSAPQMALHRRFYLWQLPATLVLQPTDSVGALSLVVERESGAVKLQNIDAPDAAAMAEPLTVYGLIGVYQLLAGPYIAVITGREQIGILRGEPVYRVVAASVVAGVTNLSGVLTPAQKADEERFIAMLKSVVEGNRYLFFSYDADITLNSQVAQFTHMQAPDRPQWQRADERFFFNRFGVQPLVEQRNLSSFILPVVYGSMQFVSTSLNGAPATLALLSRRSRHRFGTRMWRRGADTEGHVANFVETEQLLVAGGYTASLVQIRGSIPVEWAQPVDLAYKPKVRLGAADANRGAAEKHVRDLLHKYQRVTMVDLINQHGSECRLGTEFAAQVQALGQPAVAYLAYDYHKEVGSKGYAKLPALYDQIADAIRTYGYFMRQEETGKVVCTQNGVVRTNCIDCLDRTNVVQSFFAMRVLEQQLRHVRIFSDKDELLSDPDLQAVFKNLWANNGDDIAMQYTGTPALKGDVTRTGKRTPGGLLQDGHSALARYALNNFADGTRQDAFDLFLGKYAPSKSKPTPFASKGWEKLAFPPGMVQVALVVAAYMALSSLASALARGTGKSFAVFGFWASLAAAVYFVIKRKGKELVNKPKLS